VLDPRIKSSRGTAEAEEEFRLRSHMQKEAFNADLEGRIAMTSSTQSAPEQGKVQPVPEGYHTATPYLIIKGAADRIELYKKAFGAMERLRMSDPDGRVRHAETKIGDSIIMLADELPEMDARSPSSLGGTPVSILLYLEDADAMFSHAVAEGAPVVRPVQDQFYGDRMGGNQ
jgi:PhnB protein